MSARESFATVASRGRSVPAWLIRWHRLLAWPALAAILLWGATGVMHPVMSALSPVPAHPPAAQPLPAGLRPVAPPLPRTLTALRLTLLEGRPAWRVHGDGVVRWFDAYSGIELAGADAREAERLARAFTGDAASPVARIAQVTAFGPDYLPMNKLLPVWRVDFARDDGLTAFVDTDGGRLATLTDDSKRVLSTVFSAVHRWSWAGEGTFKRMGIGLLVGAAFVTLCGGLALYVLRWRAGTLRASQPAGRRLHRALGLLAVSAGLALTGSGLIHLWLARPNPPTPVVQPLPGAAPLAAVPQGVEALIAVAIDGAPVWLAATAAGGSHAEHAHHHHQHAAPGGLPRYFDGAAWLPETAARRHAAQLARAAGAPAAPVARVTLVTRFGGEYGFFQKRLPVYRIDFAAPGRPAWYVEPATGAFSTRVEETDRLEGYLFSWLHKWHWLDGLGKTPRDAILVAFVLVNMLAALVGIGLWRRRGRR
ncbi:PepSY domain-containing protein [Chitiniphilus purpureus]|uniref:PepSY domain-containing protein n=1 Tax=Chitiniphilus purpureus TaxID=2981137 RepID=A0ABY6DM00_9NEIS|nr:PepSY domain-containing protein [Chitiniphilus sp. CD1]UXY15372.1 PepSY domain-containing protein [Chitiniphilus sp. CD1]